MRTERQELRIREHLEWLVHEHDGRYAFLPGLERVAYGGAGAGPSGADTNDEIIDCRCDLFKLFRIERSPRVVLIGALDG